MMAPWSTLRLMVLLACGGSTTYLAATPHAPAAVAKIDVDEGPNRNTVGRLSVQHLAPPGRLGEGQQLYVAWVRPTGLGGWQNMGQLVVDDDRSGSLEITVPYTEFDVAVSLESTPVAQQQSGVIVLQGHVGD